MNLIENRLNTILEKILVVILGVMVINVSWQVFSRYVLANPSSFTDELARYLMIWLGVMGTAYVSGKKLHVAIDILPDKLSPKRQVKLKKIINLIIAEPPAAHKKTNDTRTVWVSDLIFE